jgi:hypothetical protein
MSVYQASIQAFAQVIDSQPKLLTHQDWVELEQIRGNLPDDNEVITELIEEWLKIESRRQLFQAYSQQLDLLIPDFDDGDIEIGRANSKSAASPDKPSESGKELLDNTIKKNSPLSDAPKSQPKP